MHNPPGRKSGVYPIWNIIEYPKRIRVLSVAIYWYFPFSIRVFSIFNPDTSQSLDTGNFPFSIRVLPRSLYMDILHCAHMGNSRSHHMGLFHIELTPVYDPGFLPNYLLITSNSYIDEISIWAVEKRSTMGTAFKVWSATTGTIESRELEACLS